MDRHYTGTPEQVKILFNPHWHDVHTKTDSVDTDNQLPFYDTRTTEQHHFLFDLKTERENIKYRLNHETKKSGWQHFLKQVLEHQDLLIKALPTNYFRLDKLKILLSESKVTDQKIYILLRYLRESNPKELVAFFQFTLNHSQSIGDDFIKTIINYSLPKFYLLHQQEISNALFEARAREGLIWWSYDKIAWNIWNNPDIIEHFHALILIATSTLANLELLKFTADWKKRFPKCEHTRQSLEEALSQVNTQYQSTLDSVIAESTKRTKQATQDIDQHNDQLKQLDNDNSDLYEQYSDVSSRVLTQSPYDSAHCDFSQDEWIQRHVLEPEKLTATVQFIQSKTQWHGKPNSKQKSVKREEKSSPQDHQTYPLSDNKTSANEEETSILMTQKLELEEKINGLNIELYAYRNQLKKCNYSAPSKECLS